MKIAYVDSLPVGGGLSRFSYMLCKSLLAEDKSLHIDYYAHWTNLKRTPELMELTGNISVKPLESSKAASFTKRVLHKSAGKMGISLKPDNGMLQEMEKRIRGYDLAYFPSAHMMPKPQLSLPVTGTIHDFNWKYFFGRQVFDMPFVEEMDRAIVNWINSGPTACSSNDVVTEAKKLYPGLRQYPEVVHIAPVVMSHGIDEATAKQVLAGLGIDYPYLIFPGNFYPHKNHLNLFTAFYKLKQKKGFENLHLLLTGLHTEQLGYGIAEKCGVQLICGKPANDAYDIRGLGYQPNQVVDVLISHAQLLVSPSLYEAICTPAMDAWHFGTPTAISDIPPFREHEKVWGIRSAFFDPVNPDHIADTLEAYLSNYEAAKNDGKISKENMLQYGWDKVARGYLKVFQKTVNNRQ